MTVNFIRNLENIFEKYIEGFFNKKFSSGLQPIEIAKQLVKEMENEKSIGVSHIFAPNNYLVYLNQEDFERISPYGQAVRDELAGYLLEEAKRREYTIVGIPIIDITMDKNLGQGKFRVTSQFTEPLPADSQAQESIDDPQELSNTRVFNKITPLLKSQPILKGLLTIIDGVDSGINIDIGATRVNIGRREGNELPLSDMNTSRLHAYIAYEDGVHVLHDAKSLNGTYVNGQRITRKDLKNKDHIKLGNTTILYEVK